MRRLLEPVAGLLLLLWGPLCVHEAAAAAVLPEEDGYDCLMRQLALSYTQDVVLSQRSGWLPASFHRKRALSLVAQGLRIKQCNETLVHQPEATIGSSAHGHQGEAITADKDVVTLYVATTGHDSAAGSAQDPLKTVSGAQAKIRSLYPSVATRPAIRVLVQPGDYFYGAAGADHLSRGTQYSNSSMVRFSHLDSGASPAKAITYAAAHPDADAPTAFIGGVPLSGLSWALVAPGSGYPTNAWRTTVPGVVSFDVQDQLFLQRVPLVRARTPNGKPWIPLDGFNLTTTGDRATAGLIGGPPTYSQCTGHREERPMQAPSPPPGGNANCSVVNRGVCLHNAYPILRSFDCGGSVAACCGNCTADPKCVSWNINTKMKTCFLRGSYKPNPGSVCISGCVRGTCAPPPPPAPRPPPPPTAGTCRAAKIVCNATNDLQVTGVLGVSTASGKALGNNLRISHCLQRSLGLANDFLNWKAQSYGLQSPCDSANCDATGLNCSSCANAMYSQYNHPFWYGPWAKGIRFDPSQDTGTKAAADFKWKDANQVVCHAMAVGEWGGVQFRVASASSTGGKTDLIFSHGGYQQARGAAFRHGSSRYYLEGDRQFLDAQGEWFFDPTTRDLFIIPPEEFTSPTAAKLNAAEVLLTQTDTLFEFVGESSDNGSRVENVVVENLTFSHTSSQFFRPHEETSGGDYSTHRSGAMKVENASGLAFRGNNFSWIGGNGVVLSASVRGVNVTSSIFRFLGTSGVVVQGKTGDAMMDGRDGERMATAHGPAADNGVRYPTGNLVVGNLFADYGIWDKQSACYHKALAPDNIFRNNVCFNASRHGVNFQDGVGGSIAEGNVMFNLNRETSDTTAFNSWSRRHYITSDPDDPAVGVLVPTRYNQWRRNFVLGRNYYGVRDGNGDGLRNDDGASFYQHSSNVLYKVGITFNGGTQIHAIGNLFVAGGNWQMGPTPDVASAFNNTYVETTNVLSGSCKGFFQKPSHRGQGTTPGIYTGDYNVRIAGTTNQSVGPMGFCGINLTDWQKDTGGQDVHSHAINASEVGYTPRKIVALAKSMLYAGQKVA